MSLSCRCLIIAAVEPKEIRTLYKRFRRLDRSRKGTISADDLLMVPEVAMNPLATRLVAMFQRDAEDRINFRSFAVGLSVFGEKTTTADKVAFVFRLFDINNDGYLDSSDLSNVLASMTGKSLDEPTVAAIVSKTLSQADRDGDGRISLRDFMACTDLFPWDELIVPVKKVQRAQYLEETAREKARGGSALPLATPDA